MRRFILVALLMLLIVSALLSQTLQNDRNGTPIQYGRSFTALTQVAPADTLWRRVSVPDGSYEAWLLATAGLHVSADSLYTANPTRYITLSTAQPITVPLLRQRQFYIRRSVVGTAASAYIVFRRM